MNGPYRAGSVEALSSAARELRARAHDLNVPSDKDLDALVKSVRWLADDSTLRTTLAESAGLSEPMVEWGLRTTVETLSVETLVALRENAGLDGWNTDNQTGLCAVVLSGNVFTASVRALVIPLALGSPVLAKASERDDALAHALAKRLPEPFRHACRVVTFGRDDDASTRAILEPADVVHAYGSDASLQSIRALVDASTLFVPHGHGVGVAVLRHDPSGAELEALCEALALDVAAYDQRGCLSPHEVWVWDADPERVARALSNALADIESRLPRGPQAPEWAAAQRRWRDVALSLGTLHEGDAHAVAVVDEPLDAVAGRHVRVVRVDDAKAAKRLDAWGTSLKALGYAPLPGNAAIIPVAIPRGVMPRCSPWGTMQTPPFDALQDGRAASFGYALRVTLR